VNAVQHRTIPRFLVPSVAKPEPHHFSCWRRSRVSLEFFSRQAKEKESEPHYFAFPEPESPQYDVAPQHNFYTNHSLEQGKDPQNVFTASSTLVAYKREMRPGKQTKKRPGILAYLWPHYLGPYAHLS
jgi:hypothetical protein